MTGEKKPKERRTSWKAGIILVCLLVSAAILACLWFFRLPLQGLLSDTLTDETNSLIFAVLMALLPLAGFPITVFLFLVGIIFGVAGGIFLTGAMMIFHMGLTYYLVHSIFRPQIISILKRFHIPAPQLPLKGRKRLALIFMLVPGLPYTVKNFLLALADLSLTEYLIIAWVAQFSLSIPVIILGKGVLRMDPLILAAAVLLLILVLAGQYYLRRRSKKDYPDNPL